VGGRPVPLGINSHGSLPVLTSACRYLSQEFCPRVGISMEQLKERLRIYCATLGAIQVARSLLHLDRPLPSPRPASPFLFCLTLPGIAWTGRRVRGAAPLRH
jgi:hypothetical protein